MPLTPLTPDLKSLYTVRAGSDVGAFVEKHAFLVPLLIETYDQIQTYFPDAICTLDVFVDPDSLDHRDLVVTIGTILDVDEAFATLKRFEKAWWFPNMNRANGYINIEIEFQPDEF